MTNMRIGILFLALAGCGGPSYYVECLAPGVARIYGPADGRSPTDLPFVVSDSCREIDGEACELAKQEAPLCAYKGPIEPL